MPSSPALPLYRAAPEAGVPGCFIANARKGQPVLVAIHGISRNAAEIASRFAVYPAFAEVTIVAPLFVRENFGKYQQMLARKPGEIASDSALLALLRDLSPELGAGTDRVLLFGFSGGAQMAHRFTMFHPERVARLCVVSAGWYCMPRADLLYPYGIGNAAGQALVGPGFLDVPITVMVGNRDTRIDETVRQDPLIIEHQGSNRLRRARTWVRAVAEFGALHQRVAEPELLTLPDMSHDFGHCVQDGNLLDLAAGALL